MDHDVLEGTFVDGKYRVGAPLASGGMATVYRAEQVHLGRTVAMKVLHPHQDRERRRFYREARHAMSIFHPHVVRTFDRGMLPDGRPYIVMELLDGTTLGRHLDVAGPLDVEQTLALAEQVLSALTAAHDLGIVHRDLKPDNVFLEGGLPRRARPDAKLLDFGIARGLHTEARMTLSGVTLGTPEYISPEQARGDAGVDHRTDLWSLGVVLYECLTGRLPFPTGNLHALLVAILRSHPVPPSDQVPTIPPALDEVILTALEKRPENRFASAGEMLWAIRDLAPTQRFAVLAP